MMIISDLVQIFLEFKQEENQESLKFLEGNSENICNFGYFTCQFIEKDTRIIDVIIPKINEFLKDEKFKQKIVLIEKTNAQNEKEAILDSNNNLEHQMIQIQLESLENKINDLTFQKIIDDCENNFKGVWIELGNIQKDIDFYRKNHTLYCISNILFEEFKKNDNKKNDNKKNRFIVPNDNKLEQLYNNYNIDLKECDSQYNKYGLLAIDNNFDISSSNITKVFDTRIRAFLLINEIDSYFLNFLSDLRTKKKINSLALRPEYNNISSDMKDLSLSLEALEQGKIFSFENLGFPQVSKLYSDGNYENKLWVNIDKNNITFEEMIKDFEIDGDDVITQVIHLQYFTENDEYFISHIDHEFIFYTIEEYEIRQTNHKQKGEAKTRFKTFKVDNSRIPFILEDSRFFLYIVLDQYFKNKDLLLEYFQKVLKSEMSL